MLGQDLWKHPYRFWVTVRWLTWLVAAWCFLGSPLPVENTRCEPFLLALSGVWTTLLTTYPGWRDRSPFFLWLEERYYLPAVEILVSLTFLGLSGGWQSHYYEYALTSVIAPALLYGTRAAFLAALGFSAVYWAIAWLWGWPSGPWSRFIASTAVNPWMVAYFSALLGELIARLEKEQAVVRRLAAQEERYRLSRDLHDGVAQTLFMLSLSLESASDRAASGPDEKLARKLQELHGVARQALWETRNAMFDPERLIDPEVPLEEALARLVREWQSVSQIKLEFQGEPCGDLSSARRVGLYRILQECLANAFKHSQAGRILISLSGERGELVLRVVDDGKGFAPAAVRNTGDGMRGRGLANLQSRAREMGADFALESAPGQGTTITLRLRNPS